MESDGNVDDGVAWFVALYCIMGVPLFGMVVGSGANSFVSVLVSGRRKLPPDLTDDEFRKVANLSVDDGVVQFGEFFILELMRQGKPRRQQRSQQQTATAAIGPQSFWPPFDLLWILSVGA